MLGRIIASTALAVALTQGAAFAQANSDNSNLPAQNPSANAASQSVTPSAQNEVASPSSAQAPEAAQTSAQAQEYTQSNTQAQQTAPSSAQAQTAAEPNAPTTQSNQVASANEANQQPIPQEIRQKLQNMGFSDVQVVPGSLIVSAKDKDGDPVSMIIGPHSTTLFSVITPDNSQQQAQR